MIMDTPKIKSKELIKKGSIVEFYSLDMEMPGGHTARWDFVSHRGAAAIICPDGTGRIYMVRQYRPGTDSITLEIPAGCVDAGEDKKTAAMRELEEEVGVKCETAEHLITYYGIPAYNNECVEIYIAKNISAGHQHLDADEQITVESYSLSELTDMILSGVIVDGKTIAGILAYKEKLNKKEI